MWVLRGAPHGSPHGHAHHDHRRPSRPDPARFVHALGEAYAHGARESGIEVRIIRVADLDVPVLRSQAEWNEGATPPSIAAAQGSIAWAEHIVILYPSGSAPCRRC
jgi:putative NADPH-quinone reductase